MGTNPPTRRRSSSSTRCRRSSAAADRVYVDRSVLEYAVNLVLCTRTPENYGLPELRTFIELGASPRASIGLVRGGRALALLRGRSYLTPQDVFDVAPEILRHRLLLSYEALAQDVDVEQVLARVLSTVPAPRVSPSQAGQHGDAYLGTPSDAQPLGGLSRVTGLSNTLGLVGDRPADEIIRRLTLDVSNRLDGMLHGDFMGIVPGRGTEPGETRSVRAGRRRAPHRLERHRPDADSPTSARRSPTGSSRRGCSIDRSPRLDFGTASCEKRDLVLGAAAGVGLLTARGGNRVGRDGAARRARRRPSPRARAAATCSASSDRILALARGSTARAPTDLGAGLRHVGSMAPRRGLIAVDLGLPDAIRRPGARRSVRSRCGTRCCACRWSTPATSSCRRSACCTSSTRPPERPERSTPTTAKLRERYAEAAGRQQRSHRVGDPRRRGGPHDAAHRRRLAAGPGPPRVTQRRHRAEVDRRTADPMSEWFLEPSRLWLLVVVVALIGLYAALQFTKPRYTVRFSNLELLDKVAPKRPGLAPPPDRRRASWRRSRLLVVSFAQPVMTVQVPQERTTDHAGVRHVAVDGGRGRRRPTASRRRRRPPTEFVDQLPDQLNVGLVGFAGTAQLLVPPTQDHDDVKLAIDGLELDKATAIGDAVKLSLDVIEDQASGRRRRDARRGDRADLRRRDHRRPAHRGRDPAGAARPASRCRPSPTAPRTARSLVDEDGDGVGQLTRVPVNVEELRGLAEGTGGTAYTAESASDLRSVYDQLGSTIGFEEEPGGRHVPVRRGRPGHAARRSRVLAPLVQPAALIRSPCSVGPLSARARRWPSRRRPSTSRPAPS